jgi:glycerol-3-phosphate dehydrogenase
MTGDTSVTGDTSMTAARRVNELTALLGGGRVDVLVVGLGVTGAGVALDAATRGLSVAAVDAGDLASGTSRWSSKLVHGGLRYLGSGQVRLAYQSAVERGILMTRVAPHLITPLPMVAPLTPAVSAGNAALSRFGFIAADVLRAAAGTRRAVLPAPRRLAAAEVRRLLPAVRRDGLRGGLVQWDGQLIDDARLVLALARTAAGHGASIVTRCRVERLHDGGAAVRDALTGETGEIRARVVVNAAGAWADGLDPSIRLRPSRGSHLVLPAAALGHPAAGLTLQVPGDRHRFVFALPAAGGRVYVGLTDEPVDGPAPEEPRAEPAEIRFLLDVLNTAVEPTLTEADLIGTYAGIRPLLAGSTTARGAARTADLSRRHHVRTSPGGLVTVVGGKLTTYRRMAADAVDAAVRHAGLAAGPCRTHRLPLVGAAAPDRLAAVPAPARLVARYGVEAPAVLAAAQDDPALLAPVADGIDVTGAELLWAVRHEGALDEADLLDRRTRIGLVAADRERALPAARRVLETEGLLA